MNKRNKSNLIASIILAVIPFGPLALLLPAGEVVVGGLVVAALIAMGVLDMCQGGYTTFPRRKRVPAGLYGSIK